MTTINLLMKTIELLSIDLNNHILTHNKKGFSIISVYDSEYLIFSMLYRKYGFIYDYSDPTTYPEIIAKVESTFISDIKVNNTGVIFDLQTPIGEVKNFYIDYLISFGYVLKS